MAEMISHPPCPKCEQPHVPGLLNCPMVGRAEGFNFGQWVEANSSKLKRMGEQMEDLLTIQTFGAPPTPEMKALETLRAVRDQLRSLFRAWRQERDDTWGPLNDDILGDGILSDDPDGTAHWLYHVLEDLDALILRHEKALVSMLEEQ